MKIVFIYNNQDELELISETIRTHSTVECVENTTILRQPLNSFKHSFNKALVFVFPDALPQLVMDLIHSVAAEINWINAASELTIEDLMHSRIVDILERARKHNPE